MLYTSESVERLVSYLSHLPGIGRKTAQRLALHILRLPQADAESLATAILDVKQKVRYCSVCSNITEADPCAICASTKRDRRPK
jgi:recombination protein RecR